MKIGIVVNPVAGGGCGRKIWPAVRRALESRRLDFHSLETAKAGDACGLSRRLADEGSDLVIAVGGDGTVSDTIDGILSSRRPETAFSLIPGGTGSDFARNFRLPADPCRVVADILAAPIRRIDAGRLTCIDDAGVPLSRHFVNIASLGVSGAIVRVVNRVKCDAPAPGGLRFLYHTAVELLRYQPDAVRILVDGEAVFEGEITVVAVANGRWFGGGMKVAPMADPADGLFEIVIIRAGSRWNIPALLAAIRAGAHVRSRLVSTCRGRCVEVLPLEGGRLPAAGMDCDGEAPGRIPVRFDMLPGALRLKL